MIRLVEREVLPLRTRCRDALCLFLLVAWLTAAFALVKQLEAEDRAHEIRLGPGEVP